MSFGQIGLSQAATGAPVNTTSAYSGGRLMTADPAGGYWTVTNVGAIASYGGAPVFGSPALSGIRPSMPVVGMAPTPNGQGYWLVASDGGIFSFGDAQFYGSTGAIHLNQAIVGMAPTPDGRGYSLVASDGGIFSFGDAQFYGSTGAIHLNQPIVSMAPTPDGRGYWLVASDGGIFSFGDAQFYGSLGGSGKSIIGIIISPPRLGYTLVETDGTAVVFPTFTTKATKSTPTPTPTPTSGPVGAGPWNMAFDSEFNGSSLDTSQWSTGWFGSGITTGVSSSEQQCYDPSQVSVTSGALVLSAVARAETCGGSVHPYASGMVTTDGNFSFTYGYMEARIWMPGSGSIADWPAFWADGQNWPTNGEIDTVEGLGGQACAHFHNPAGGPGACAAGNYSGGWHTFAADWEPGSLTFYYDGTPVWTDTSGITSAPMYLILNLALSSAITSPNTAPAAMLVDYVRVWQH
jgi:beta-glucanase (GH16 family)